MTELEKDIIQKLIDKKFIKFYIRYVDDTLLLVKDEDIDPILKELNSYNKNIKFTVDRFIHEDVHFKPWKLKISWIKALHYRAYKICSNKQALDKQMSSIKTFMSWNGYPKRV